MERIFRDYQLKHIDEDLVRKLGEIVETLILDRLLRAKVSRCAEISVGDGRISLMSMILVVVKDSTH